MTQRHPVFLMLSLGLMLIALPLRAEEVSDDCLLSMQKTYKFYYQNIQTKKAADTDPDKKLEESDLNEMHSLISQLKTHCPLPLIARLNQNLQENKV